MVYLFEFFVFDGDQRHTLDRVTHRAKSVEHAQDRAKSIMKNVKIRDRRAELCEVKDQMGNVLSVVPADGVSLN